MYSFSNFSISGSDISWPSLVTLTGLTLCPARCKQVLGCTLHRQYVCSISMFMRKMQYSGQPKIVQGSFVKDPTAARGGIPGVS